MMFLERAAAAWKKRSVMLRLRTKRVTPGERTPEEGLVAGGREEWESGSLLAPFLVLAAWIMDRWRL